MRYKKDIDLCDPGDRYGHSLAGVDGGRLDLERHGVQRYPLHMLDGGPDERAPARHQQRL